MAKIRVLVVDDSVVIRKLLTTTLNEDPSVEVVATASLGKIALAKIPQLNPDLVILDVEMPEMDGLETLSRIRKEWPRLPVIMFSTKTERGAAATIEALARGASDYVAKPSNVGSVVIAMARVREEMVPKIRALVRRPGGAAAPPVSTSTSTSASTSTSTSTSTTAVGQLGAPLPTTPVRAPDRNAETALVVIGSSTGGPNALTTVLPQLPADFPVPILIVQHMLPTFTRHFADRLAAQCKLKVVEATHGEPLRAGTIYIARGDYHLLVERRGPNAYVVNNQGTPENFCRPAVDVLFNSVARVYGASVLGVILTGMGQDGLRGARAIRDAGGNVIAQDEATSVVWGMPGFVVGAGLATQVLPIERVAGEIERLTGRGPRSALTLSRSA